MEIHSVGAKVNADMMAQVQQNHQKPVLARPFTDPIREFHRASQIEGTVRNWLTLDTEARKEFTKRLVPCLKYVGEPSRGIQPETDQAFEMRQLERWRALCVIVQEESRAVINPKAGTPSPEVAILALKQLFPDHPWPKPAEAPKGK